MIRAYALAAAAGVALFSVNTWAADPLPTETRKLLPAAVAVEAAQAAIAACKAQGYNVSAAVADRDGTQRVLIARDGSVGVTADVARRKAYTSAKLGVSTGDYTKRVSNPGAFNPGMYDRRLSTGQGGLPIKVGNETIGGMAVAGAPGGDKDEACVRAGLDKVKDQLS